MTAIAEGRPAHGLWERIESFPFDSGPTVFSFWARLAYENGWSMPFAARVITEYRRFLYLAVVAGHEVSPSDAVDQAWHLHLLYTESYWNRLCRDVLQKPLHHQPTVGGPSERAKFDTWYRNTLESYRREFLQDPPADIWPAPQRHAKQDGRSQRVNTRCCWVIRKPWR
jgi:hypothetical protein